MDKEKQLKIQHDELKLEIGKLALLSATLIFLNIVQYTVLQTYFSIIFESGNFGQLLPTDSLVSLLIAGSLPVTAFADELKLFKNAEVSLEVGGKKLRIRPVHIVIIADFFLTFLSVLANSEVTPDNVLARTAVSLGTPFSVALIFSVANLGLIKIIKLQYSRLAGLWDDSKTETVRSDRNKLSANLDEAQKENKRLSQRVGKYKEYHEKVLKKEVEIRKLQKLAQETVPQIMGGIKAISDSLSEMEFPSVELPGDKKKDPRQSYHEDFDAKKWEDFWEKLDQEVAPPSPPVRSLLESMEGRGLPAPLMRSYEPLLGRQTKRFASCTIMDFSESYDLLVYCRDEKYDKGEDWSEMAEQDFLREVNSQTRSGKKVLQYSIRLLMSEPAMVVEEIKQSAFEVSEKESEGANREANNEQEERES